MKETATPVLRLDLDVVAGKYRDISQAMPQTAIHYAVKCQPDIEVLRRLHAEGCSFEIASYPELQELQSLGVNPLRVLFSNPVKAPEHIAATYQQGVRIFAADSSCELVKLAQYAPGSKVVVRVKTSTASLVPSEGKFGVSATVAVELLHEAQGMGLTPYGLGFHVGSQMLDASAWARAIAVCGTIMEESLVRHGIKVELIDIGGGFPVPYRDCRPPSITEIASSVHDALCALPYAVATAAEPGRYLVAEAGVLTTTVIGRAERDGAVWLHLDAGAFNGFMEALESHNTLLFPTHDSLSREQTQQCHLTGPTCDSQDTIMFDVPVSAGLTMGDTIDFWCAGAYSTGYASEFNGFKVPAISYERENSQVPTPALAH